MLRPEIDADSAPFFEAARAGVLKIQRCPQTGRFIFPPRPGNPWSPGTTPVWTEVSGRGTIWSFVVPHPPLLPEFAALSPYNVVLVSLEEDPAVRLIGNLVASRTGEINEIDPSTIEIGAPVRAVFHHIDDALTLPRWIRA